VTPRAVVLALLVLAPAAGAWAEEPAPTRSAIVDELVDSAARRTGETTIREPFAGTVDASSGLIVSYLLAVESEDGQRSAYRTLLNAMDARAAAKQVGAAPGGQASTSLALKGLVPEVLGFAVERGAIAQEIDGTNVTFRASPVGVIQALAGNDLEDIYRQRSQGGLLRFASKVSASATFDTSRGEHGGSLAADRQQLSAWSVRFNAFNGRDPGAPQYAPFWRRLATASTPYITARTAIAAALGGWVEFTAWNRGLIRQVQAVDAAYARDRDLATATASFRAILEATLPDLADLGDVPPLVRAALDTYASELGKVQEGVDAVHAFAEKGLVATLECNATRDATLPDLYALTGVLEMGVGARRQHDLAVNVGMSFYREPPADTAPRFKSFSASAEYSHALGRIGRLPLTLSVSGRYEHLPEDVAVSTVAGSATPAPADIAPKGDILVGQAKLTFPLGKGSGVRVPIALTVANRTELIKEREVKANFGFTFDLDAVLGAALGR